MAYSIFQPSHDPSFESIYLCFVVNFWQSIVMPQICLPIMFSSMSFKFDFRNSRKKVRKARLLQELHLPLLMLAQIHQSQVIMFIKSYIGNTGSNCPPRVAIQLQWKENSNEAQSHWDWPPGTLDKLSDQGYTSLPKSDEIERGKIVLNCEMGILCSVYLSQTM